jgi:hypothetical protein
VELLGVEGENPQARGPAQLEFGLAERAFSRALVRLQEGFALPGRSTAPGTGVLEYCGGLGTLISSIIITSS